MSDRSPELWEVWHARFNYEEGKGYKYRPVIIVGRGVEGDLVMMVTSATNKRTLEHDYLLKDWEAAGLDKPSIARADRIAEVPASYLGTAGRIGSLSARDRVALSAILEQIARSA